MNVFLTNQKKLAAAVEISQEHLSRLKKGLYSVSDDVAGKLEAATGIKKIVWASATDKSEKLGAALDRFFRDEKARELAAIKKRMKESKAGKGLRKM